jgi:hypothetical protein
VGRNEKKKKEREKQILLPMQETGPKTPVFFLIGLDMGLSGP